MTADIRLLIVDDHPLVRDGLRGIFAAEDGFDVVGEASGRRGGNRRGLRAEARRRADGPAHAGNGSRRSPAFA